MAGLALAAAGMLYRRVTGRKPEATPVAPTSPAGRAPADSDQVDDAQLAQARNELADELGRRASRDRS
jgi:hypothetical protein